MVKQSISFSRSVKSRDLDGGGKQRVKYDALKVFLLINNANFAPLESATKNFSFSY